MNNLSYGWISPNDFWVLEISCVLAVPQSFGARAHLMLPKNQHWSVERGSSYSSIAWGQTIFGGEDYNIPNFVSMGVTKEFCPILVILIKKGQILLEKGG